MTAGYIVTCQNTPMLLFDDEHGTLCFGHKGKGTLFPTRIQAKRAAARTIGKAQAGGVDWVTVFGEIRVSRVVYSG